MKKSLLTLLFCYRWFQVLQDIGRFLPFIPHPSLTCLCRININVNRRRISEGPCINLFRNHILSIILVMYYHIHLHDCITSRVVIIWRNNKDDCYHHPILYSHRLLQHQHSINKEKEHSPYILRVLWPDPSKSNYDSFNPLTLTCCTCIDNWHHDKKESQLLMRKYRIKENKPSQGKEDWSDDRIYMKNSRNSTMNMTHNCLHIVIRIIILSRFP